MELKDWVGSAIGAGANRSNRTFMELKVGTNQPKLYNQKF